MKKYFLILFAYNIPNKIPIIKGLIAKSLKKENSDKNVTKTEIIKTITIPIIINFLLVAIQNSLKQKK